MKRLLFIAPNAEFFISHRLEIAKCALKEGYRVGIACPYSDAVDDLINLDFEYFQISMKRGSINPVVEIQTLCSVRKAIQTFRPSVVHLITSKPIVYGGLICRIHKIPCVAAVSGLGHVFVSDTWKARILRRLIVLAYRLSLNHSTCHVIFQNTSDKAVFKNSGILRKNTSSLIPGCGVDLKKIQRHPLPEGQTVVSLPARLIAEKGVREFINAVKILKTNGIEARFQLLGKPDPCNPSSISEDEIQMWVDSGAVEWSGFVSDMNQALRDTHIVVLPSYREGFPKTLVDAAAAGRVSITTDVPGCKDAIKLGETGFLVPCRDAVALAERLQLIIQDREMQEHMGVAARKHAEEYFDVNYICRLHLEIYETQVSL